MFVIFYGFGALFAGLLYATFWVVTGMLALMACAVLGVLALVGKAVEALTEREMNADGATGAKLRALLPEWLRSRFPAWEDARVGQTVWLARVYAGRAIGTPGRVIGRSLREGHLTVELASFPSWAFTIPEDAISFEKPIVEAHHA